VDAGKPEEAVKLLQENKWASGGPKLEQFTDEMS